MGAVKDMFASVSVEVTDASTGVDLRDYSSFAIMVDAGTSPSLVIEESDDDSTYTTVASEDLLYQADDGKSYEGSPTIANDTEVIIRYRGQARYLRVTPTNATAHILRGKPDNAAITQAIAAP